MHPKLERSFLPYQTISSWVYAFHKKRENRFCDLWGDRNEQLRYWKHCTLLLMSAGGRNLIYDDGHIHHFSSNILIWVVFCLIGYRPLRPSLSVQFNWWDCATSSFETGLMFKSGWQAGICNSVLYLLGLGDGKVCVNSRFIEGVNMNSETNCERCWGIVNARVLEKIVKHFSPLFLVQSFSCATSHSKGFLCWKEFDCVICSGIRIVHSCAVFTHQNKVNSPFHTAWVSKPKETKDWQTEVGQGGENSEFVSLWFIFNSTRLFATLSHPLLMHCFDCVLVHVLEH